MQIRSDRGWIKAGLAVLVTGVLGGGVLAATGGTGTPRRITADGVTGPPAGLAPAGAAASPLPEPEKKPDPTVGDKVMVGDDGGSVTVSAVEDNVSAGRLFGAGEGNKYIAAEVKGCSGPKEKNISFEPAYFLLRLDDGTVHDPGAPAKKPSLEGGTIPAGKCLSGWVTFTVKNGALPTGVIYDGSSRLTWTVPLPKGAKPTTTTRLSPGAATASSTTATTAKAKAANSSGGSSTTSTTGSKAKVSSSTTSTTRAKATTGSTGTSSTTSTTRSKASSTTTSTKPGGTSTSTTKPVASSTTSTTAKEG